MSFDRKQILPETYSESEFMKLMQWNANFKKKKEDLKTIASAAEQMITFVTFVKKS